MPPKPKPGSLKKDTSSMYNFQNVYTGPDSTDPGVLKAQADKKKRDAIALAYKKKIKKSKLGGPVPKGSAHKKTTKKK